MQQHQGEDQGARRLLVFEHDDLCLPGNLVPWAAQRDITLNEWRVDRERPPDPSAFDGLIVLGSVESAYDERIQSWYEPEIAAIRAAVAARVPLLGICFGAQSLSLALGGQVQRAPEEELGWLSIRTSEPEKVEAGPWLQWHHDSFTLPNGARQIADSAAGVQAFTHDRCFAVQFHPEVDAAVATLWIGDPEGAAEVRRCGLDPGELLAESLRLAPERERAAHRLFDRALLGAAVPR